MVRKIEVDDEVWAELQKRAVPLDDKEANDVLRREFGLNGHSNAVLRLPGNTTRPSVISSVGSRRSRLPRGERTPELDYVIPILQALVQAGGRGRTSDIVNRVGEIMKNRLNELDHKTMSAGQIRWRNAAEFCRNTMVHTTGTPLLNPSAPHGWWEITDAGREHLKSNSH